MDSIRITGLQEQSMIQVTWNCHRIFSSHVHGHAGVEYTWKLDVKWSNWVCFKKGDQGNRIAWAWRWGSRTAQPTHRLDQTSTTQVFFGVKQLLDEYYTTTTAPLASGVDGNSPPTSLIMAWHPLHFTSKLSRYYSSVTHEYSTAQMVSNWLLASLQTPIIWACCPAPRSTPSLSSGHQESMRIKIVILH